MRYNFSQAARLTALVALVVLTGCHGLIGNLSSSQVRIIDVSPESPSLDIYQNHSALAYSLGFGTITSYVPVTAGTYTIAATSTGSSQVISAAKSAFLPANQYTVLIGNTAVGPSLQADERRADQPIRHDRGGRHGPDRGGAQRGPDLPLRREPDRRDRDALVLH